MSAEKKLKDLGIDLGAMSAPMANYVNAVRTGKLLFLAGKGPGPVKGKLGLEFSIDQGYRHARAAGLALLAVMGAERVKRVVKVLGMVNAVPEFTDHPKVINGCSDLFVEVFGDAGKHARSAVGMGSLPMGIPVEIECIVEIYEAPAKNKPAAKLERILQRRREPFSGTRLAQAVASPRAPRSRKTASPKRR
jgi:enamine deaminase RidA (YjgF/YER057c/UK114 family)